MNPSDQQNTNTKQPSETTNDAFDDPLSSGSMQRRPAMQGSRDFGASGSSTTTTTSTNSLGVDGGTRKKGGLLGALDGKLVKKKESKDPKEVKNDPLSGGTVTEKVIVEEKPKENPLTDRNSLFEPLNLSKRYTSF